MEKLKILAVNPGSTSTKIAVFHAGKPVFKQILRHSTEELGRFKRVADQFLFRKRAILECLQKGNITLEEISCIVARGGMLKPVSGGTFNVNELMCEYLRHAGIEHASNLGALIAKEIADNHGIPAYVVDPPVVDEMEPLARISGVKGIERKSIFHALNQKAIARKAAASINKDYEKSNLIVAHLGGGISVGAHQGGRVIDVNNALDGDGPFSPERSGGIPVCSIIDLCFCGSLNKQELYRMVVGKGGLAGYIGINDTLKIEEIISGGNEEAGLVYEAMAYQTAKEIGSCAAVLKGKVDLIALTGGIAHSGLFTGWIRERVEYIAPVAVFPGEDEMEALAEGALRVLSGFEQCREYM